MHGWTCQRCLVPIVANLSSILSNVLVLVLYGRAKLELTFISVFTWVAIIIVLPGYYLWFPKGLQKPLQNAGALSYILDDLSDPEPQKHLQWLVIRNKIAKEKLLITAMRRLFVSIF